MVMKMKSMLDYTEETLLNDNENRMKRITEFLNFLYSNADENDVFEVRVLTHSKQTQSELFKVKDINDDDFVANMIISLEKEAGDDLKGVYVTINVADESVLADKNDKKSIHDKDIKKILNFVIDVDVHDRILTREEKAELENAVIVTSNEVFGRQGVAYLINDSGFGYHVFVKLRPIIVDSEETKVAYRKVASNLALEFLNKLKEKQNIVDDIDLSVYNLSRIMRVAFTKNIRYINNEKYLALDKIIVKRDGKELDLSDEIKKEIEKLMKVDESVFIDEKSALTQEDIERVVNAVKPYYRPGRRHNLVLGLSAFLFWRGIDYNSAKKIITKLIEETEDTEVNDRIQALDDTYKTDRLKSYRTHFFNALQDEKELSKFIYALNNALKEYYSRLKYRDDDDAITDANRILNNEFSLYNFLIEHTTDIIKETDEKTGNVTLKVKIIDDKTRKHAEFVLRNISHDFYKTFYAINDSYFDNFAHFIVDKKSIKTLAKEDRSNFREIIEDEIEKYAKFIVKNARVVIKEEYEDVKNEFFDIIEYHANRIVKIASEEAISNETLKKLLEKYKFVYDETKEKIYMSTSITALAENQAIFARRLAKLLHKLNIIEKASLRDVRKMRKIGNDYFLFYELDAQRFFELLDGENSNEEYKRVIYNVVDFDETIISDENNDNITVDEVIEE